ncbi:MAG TPA: ABC transporter permease [Verrucomicrobiae bacterium]|jgi:putative ABC transport system permease protein|nr:ABC transporter permease [Verrucomicrobiae bacterium]
MYSFRQDFRFALRQLRKSPGFTIVAVLTLALGIGAATAMFSVIYATVLRSLPFPDPERIVYVETHAAASYIQPSSWPGYQDERAQNQSFDYLAGFSQFAGVNLDTGSQVIHLHNTSTSDHFFDVFGVKPLVGRTFLPGEEQEGRNNVAVLSYEVWQQNFGGNPSAVGSSVHIDGFPYTIVGVMPAGFRFPLSMPNLIYTPLRISKELRTARGDHWLQIIGHLKPGLTVEQAQADMNHVLVNLGRTNPDTDKGRTARVMPLTMHITGQEEREALWIMAAGVLFVLLIACVDVAVMLLARGVGRQREMAIRTALGAGRVRIVRQILFENLVLGLISAGVGLLLAWGLTMGMSQFLTKSFQRGGNIQLNWAVFLAAFAIAALSSLAFGLIPAKKMSSVDPNRSLKSGAAAGTDRGDYRLRSGFVIAEVALSLMLLVCTGLVLMQLWRMQHLDFGYTTDHLLTLEINVSPGEYAGKDLDAALYRPLADKVRAIPGVTGVGYNRLIPLIEWGWNSGIEMVGKPPDPPDHERLAEVRMVSPGWYQAMGLKLLRGRLFDPGIDKPGAQDVVVVNQKFVDTFLPGEEPIGQQIKQDSGGQRIVGVVSNGRQSVVDSMLAEVDYPMSQVPLKDSAEMLTPMALFVRTTVPPDAIVSQLRQALHEVAPSVPFQTPETMDDVLAESLVFDRMQGWLFSIFAAIALVLALIGIYGVLSQEVSLQTRDIGLRMALGASRPDIVRMVLQRAALMMSIGVAVGVLGSVVSRRLLASVIPIEVSRDAAAIATLAIGLSLVGLVASMIPARRAASIEPMQALRNE